MSTHNICFCGEIRKILCGYPLLWTEHVQDYVKPHILCMFEGSFSFNVAHILCKNCLASLLYKLYLYVYRRW